jgi:membrane associated rhomboid family serine protease
MSLFKFTSLRSALVPGFVFVLVIWTVFYVEVTLGFRFNRYGVYPLTLQGLRGVLFSPFIHSGLNHLWSNTVPLFVLTGLLCYFYAGIRWRVMILGVLGSGLLTWLIGRDSYHIGASGFIYMLASFLVFKGWFTRHFKLMALSFVVTMFYGSLVWYVLPIKQGMSWEGHLSGFLMGLFLARFIKVKIPAKPKFYWEKDTYDETNDPFMRHFDANGNFIEIDEEE